MAGNGSTKYCRNCGQSMHQADRFCPRCGADQRGGQRADAIPTASYEPEPETQVDDTDWAKLAIYSAIIILSVLGFMWGMSVLNDVASSGPEDTVEEFWAAIDDGDVQQAEDMTTTEFNMDAGDDIRLERASIETRNIDTQSETDSTANIHAEVLLEAPDGRWILYDVEHNLEKIDDEWKITGMDREISDMSM